MGHCCLQWENNKRQTAKLFYLLTLVNMLAFFKASHSSLHDEIIVFLRKVKVFLDFGAFAQIAGGKYGDFAQ
jgi:hypothetical protein